MLTNRGTISIIKKVAKQTVKSEYADMAELADAHGSGPCEYCFRGGSNPLIRTKEETPKKVSFFIRLRKRKEPPRKQTKASEVRILLLILRGFSRNAKWDSGASRVSVGIRTKEETPFSAI